MLQTPRMFRLYNLECLMPELGLTLCLVWPFWPFYPIYWDGNEIEKMVLKMVWNYLKMIYKNDVRMIWLCWFWGNMNGWDLKILYKDLESWKKWLKKMKWNGIVWRIWKVEKNGMEWNGRNGWNKQGVTHSKYRLVLSLEKRRKIREKSSFYFSFFFSKQF